MFKAQPWGRVAMTGAMVAVCAAAACQTVLDIEEPIPLPQAGAAGDGGHDTSIGGGGGAGSVDRALAGDGGQAVAIAGSASADAGEGGAGSGIVTPECEDDRLRCAGETDKTPQVCVRGRWTQNEEESPGECEALCASGRCVECVGSEKRCSECGDDEEGCSQRVPQTCKDGAWEDAAQPCPHYCAEGVCQEPPSCPPEAALASDCDGESCCLSLHVPGGTFKRNYAEVAPFIDNEFPAKISPFLLDKFEVTVGRMQQFVVAFEQLVLKEGDGKASRVADDRGWSTENVLPASKEALQASLTSCGVGSSFIEGGGANQKLPINCLDFNTAYAFCIWDGGRLPTDAEWNFAAAGGEEQRLFPWRAPLSGPAIDPSYAVFESVESLPGRVGSKPKGNARWGHADLAGNVGEMVLDFSRELVPNEVCDDCVFLTPGAWRRYRGGSFIYPSEYIAVPFPQEWDQQTEVSDIGFRCARDIK